MKNSLPFKTDVKLTSYPYLADYLSILNANKYDYSGIVFNNYIELFYKPWKGQIRFLNQRKLQSCFNIIRFHFPISDPIQFVIENIDKNQYIVIVLKLNNVHLDDGFQALDLYHNWIIYGYDMTENKINIAGYVRKNGVNAYKKFEISVSDFLSSLPQSDNETNYKKNIMFNHLCVIKKGYLPEKVNYNKIKHTIKKFVFKIPPFIFNRSVYKRLILHIKIFSKSSFIPHNRSLLDIRDFKTIYEHTIIIYDLICLISKNQELICQYKEIKNCAFSLVLLVARYRNNLELAKKLTIQKKAIEKIEMIDKKEKIILKKLLKEI